MKWFLLLTLVLLGAACSPTTGPVRSFTKGDELAYYDFSQAGSFEEGSYADGAARLEIRDGRYNIDLTEGDNEFWYGQWGDSLSDVVIDVETRQATESQNTIYGVACRMRGSVGQVAAASDSELTELAAQPDDSTVVAQAEGTAEATVEPAAEGTAEATSEPTAESTAEATAEATLDVGASTSLETNDSLTLNNGDGYLFLIEGNGRFAIMRSRGRSITPLVDWTTSSVIQAGPGENRIRAVCMGTYLALYINGQFVADASDDTYTRGQVGMVAAAASRLGVQVTFDNLSISEAKAG